ncbi:hypothetical protein LOAG_00048 [Loa loa]|uniref:Uncharacterized protein n=1 Tax=Loa loa TaxID=7209 RepID=A0A1S0UC25_LOALO|nr:hypothetical protein LOAG_00048 [Loa loa]EFO28452.1 hypothetical protein LOAG_00048 [Loa loa]
MEDLGKISDLVCSGDSDDSEMLSLLKPYYSLNEMGSMAIGSIGASISGGIEPAGNKHGYISRPFEK